MLNLWGYTDVLTVIGNHVVAFLLLYMGINLGVAAVVNLLKAAAKGLRA